MVRATRLMLRLYLAAVCLLALCSLGSFSEQAFSFLRVLAGPAAFGFLLLRLFNKGKDPHPHYLETWVSLLVVWLGVQQAAIWLQVPFFQVPSSWNQWFDSFSVFFCGALFYLLAQHVFSMRVALLNFIRFLIVSSAAVGVYFVYLFYTSGVPVEHLRPPFPLIQYLGSLGPVSFQPNNLVDVFIPGFFFCISLILYHQRRRLNYADPTRAYSEVLLNLCFGCVILAAILFTKSRAGIVSFLLALGLYFLLFSLYHRRRPGALKLISLLMAVSFVFLCSLGLKDIIKELGSISSSIGEEIETMGTRTATIGASWELVKEKGFLGVGLGNFHMGWLLFHNPPYLEMPARSYNDPLWFWAETGLPGVILFSGFFISFFLGSLRTLFRTRSCFVAYFLISSIAVFAAFSLHAMIDPTFYVAPLFWLLCISMGVGGACRHLEFLETHEVKNVADSKTTRSGVGPLLVFLSLGAVISWFSGGRLAAFQIAASTGSIEHLARAARWDRLSPVYPRQLAHQYFVAYATHGDAESLNRAIEALDEAIRRDPMNVIYYRNRAEMFFKAGDSKGVNDSFLLMEQRLPEYYAAKLQEAAFYIDASVELSGDADLSSRYQAHSLRQYLKALDWNPKLSKQRDLFPWLSDASRARFTELLRQKKQ